MLCLLLASLVYTALLFIEYILFYSDSLLEILFKFGLTFLKACIVHLTVQETHYFLDFYCCLIFLKNCYFLQIFL